MSKRCTPSNPCQAPRAMWWRAITDGAFNPTPPSDEWILATGVWRDEGVWQDDDVWID